MVQLYQLIWNVFFLLIKYCQWIAIISDCRSKTVLKKKKTIPTNVYILYSKIIIIWWMGFRDCIFMSAYYVHCTYNNKVVICKRYNFFLSFIHSCHRIYVNVYLAIYTILRTSFLRYRYACFKWRRRRGSRYSMLSPHNNIIILRPYLCP